MYNYMDLTDEVSHKISGNTSEHTVLGGGLDKETPEIELCVFMV